MNYIEHHRYSELVVVSIFYIFHVLNWSSMADCIAIGLYQSGRKSRFSGRVRSPTSSMRHLPFSAVQTCEESVRFCPDFHVKKIEESCGFLSRCSLAAVCPTPFPSFPHEFPLLGSDRCRATCGWCACWWPSSLWRLEALRTTQSRPWRKWAGNGPETVGMINM